MKRFQWIDSHCHFDFVAFDGDRQKFYDQAVGIGMVAMVIPGVTPDDSAQQFSVVDRYPNLYGAIGLHPWWVDRWKGGGKEQLYSVIAEQVECLGAKAIGECGLDAAIETPMVKQLQMAEVQCQLAVDLNLPLILHVRRAHNEMQVLLKRFNLPRGGVVHAFSGSSELATAYIKKGIYLGAGGLLTYPRAKKSRKAFAEVSLEFIVTETDAPDMPLYREGDRDERNLPIYLPEIIATLAELRGETETIVAETTVANSRRLFFI